MKKHILLILVVVLPLLIVLTSVNTSKTEAQTSGQFIRNIAPSGATSFPGQQAGTEGAEGGNHFIAPTNFVNRSLSRGSGQGAPVAGAKHAKSNPEINLSFDGLNHRDQRLANGGNQFSLEPPDQGLCVGNGYVLESVNDVLRVYDTNGNALMGVVDLNTFYGYPSAINRATGVNGPFVTDPSCYYDLDVQRWFHVVLTLDTNPVNGDFTGPNHLDIAVSQTSSPLGAWTIYRLPVQNDGTQATPNHGCSFGPCIGDYPHVGADAHGFYITTNEYSLFGPEYKSANIYAFSKRALAAGGPLVVVQFDTPTADAGKPGFTVWPAVSPGGQYRTDNGGTEFLLSSNAAAEVNCPSDPAHCSGPGSSSYILLWRLTNTASLDTASPILSLSNVAIPVGTYAIPPKSDQKPGDFPLGECINDTTAPNPCWKLLFSSEPAHNEVISHLDSNDTRMQQVMYANGKLWGALDTAVTVGGVNKAGIEWFIINPGSNKVVKEGYLALENNNLSYPAVAVTRSGRGVIAFSVVGADHYPSAGYASIDAIYGVGDVHVAAEGSGPSDGFTSYKAFVGAPPRTRWGDYGAAVVDGNTIWMASEYIAQTCTLAEYMDSPFGSCGGTRTSIGNWATRITQVIP